MYEKITHNIRVTVESFFLPDQSRPFQSHFVWAYEIEIENQGTSTVQLLNRHWKITDARGVMQEVRGPGVVGEQPVLEPGESFRYNSGTPLRTPSGMMVGTYEMMDEDGEHFFIDVPAFSLDSPHERTALN